MDRPLPEDADLMVLVDRYKAMLDEIARCKLHAAALAGSPAARRRAMEAASEKSREAEELERKIDELRAKILAKEGEIRGLGKSQRHETGGKER